MQRPLESAALPLQSSRGARVFSPLIFVLLAVLLSFVAAGMYRPLGVLVAGTAIGLGTMLRLNRGDRRCSSRSAS